MKFSAIITAVLAALSLAHTAKARDWSVDHDASTLGFVATYDEIPFPGRFRQFEAGIRFDPETPADGSFVVTIDITSVDTDSPDRDAGMLESDWFDTTQYPLARFESTRFERRQGAAGYATVGNLTIKGISRPVTASFHWVQSDDTVRLHGSADVKRGDFGIGTGDWADDDTIGFDVRIEFDLTLKQ